MLVAALAGFVLLIPVVTAPLAFAGHYALANDIAEEKSVSWRTWWDGARRYWRPAAIWLGLYVLMILILLANLRFYARLNVSWAPLLQGIWVTLFILWVAVNLYVMPLYLLQTDQRLRLSYRNAALLAVSDPLTTFVLLVLLVLLFVLLSQVALPLILLLPPFTALVGAIAVRLRLEKEGLWQPFDSEVRESEPKPRVGRAPPNQRPVRPRSPDERQ
ncbi:MAG TPA: hypothetical protein DEP84_04885 [Chloroflexi bacterium]|nr:hypothetical protein [Chloroflexota bacterium]